MIRKIILFSLIVVFLRTNIFGQVQNDENFEYTIQENSIVGAKLHVTLKSNSDFKFEIPQTGDFTYLKTLKTTITNSHYGEFSESFIKNIEFRCEQAGEIEFPKILVILKSDSIYTNPKIINVLEKGTSGYRSYDTETGLIKIEKIEELDKKNDLLVLPILRESTIELGDSIKIDLIVKTALSNKIEFLKIKNLVIDSTKSIYERPKLANVDLIESNGINYKVMNLITVIMIPVEKGKYKIDSGLLELNVGIKKETDDFLLKMIDEQELKPVILNIPEIRFKVKNKAQQIGI